MITKKREKQELHKLREKEREREREREREKERESERERDRERAREKGKKRQTHIQLERRNKQLRTRPGRRCELGRSVHKIMIINPLISQKFQAEHFLKH